MNTPHVFIVSTVSQTVLSLFFWVHGTPPALLSHLFTLLILQSNAVRSLAVFTETYHTKIPVVWCQSWIRVRAAYFKFLQRWVCVISAHAQSVAGEPPPAAAPLCAPPSSLRIAGGLSILLNYLRRLILVLNIDPEMFPFKWKYWLAGEIGAVQTGRQQNSQS